jgi:hypothetical protein
MVLEMEKETKQPLIKSFWKSRNLFSKRFLAPGGPPEARLGGGFSVTFVLIFIFLFFFAAAAAEKGKGKGKHAELNRQFRSISEQMKDFYQNGKLEEVIGLYEKNCLKEGKEKEKKNFKKVNKEVRAEIYRLLYLSYTALDMPGAAEGILRKFLVIRHREGVDKSDWVYIRKIAGAKYYVAPRFLVGLKLGTNFTMMQPGDRYMVLEPVDSTRMDFYQKDYVFHLNHSRGTQFGMVLEYALTKHLSITIQPAVSTVKFKYTNTFTREREGKDDLTLNYTHRHKLGYIEIPVLLTYRRITGKFKPYFQVGGYYSLLQSGEKLLQAVSLPDEEYKEEAIVDIKQQFTTSNFGFWLGAGLEYELNNMGIRLQAGVSYRHGLNNITDKAQRYENKELMFSYYDVFDDMKPGNWALSVKVLLPLSYKAFRR